MDTRNYYVTTPLYYVNGELHIGGAYTTIAADILARYHRSHEREVFFLTGSDEHGQKILRAAQEQGMPPKAFADSIVTKFHELWKTLGITHNKFIRTTDDYHEASVTRIFQKLIESGDIYFSRYEGWYCTPCENFFKEPGEGVCPSCNRPLEKIEEDNYFFRLSKYQDFLLKHIDSHNNFILPISRRNEIRNRIAEGLEDLSISRSSFDWGVPFPGDEKHVIYVWVDALFNYITALGAPDDTELFRKFWPADVQLVGKDIIWFHCVIWPALLKALDYPLPRTIFAHGWWTINGEKISKSRGKIIYPTEITRKYGRDALRFYLFREVPFGKDGDFTITGFDNRYHSELANDLGNLLMRTVSMITKYYGGKIPEPHTPHNSSNNLQTLIEKLPFQIEAGLAKLDFSGVLEIIWQSVREANRFVEQTKPWLLAKQEDKAQLDTVLYTLAEAVRLLLTNLYPFLPDSVPAGLRQLGVEWNADDLQSQEHWGLLKPGTAVTKGSALFPRIDRE